MATAGVSPDESTHINTQRKALHPLERHACLCLSRAICVPSHSCYSPGRNEAIGKKVPLFCPICSLASIIAAQPNRL
jgi:hypothetical protein